MILAGDIGGTKTRLALCDGSTVVTAETLSTAAFASAEALVSEFVQRHVARVDRACFGIAGPVSGGYVPPVNLPWPVDGSSLERMLGARVTLVNDVEANARGIEELDPGDLEVLNAGVADPAGARAVVSAGTGLGEAALWWDGSRHRAAASEGGHCSFAPQSEIEVELYRFLAAEYGHVSYERVCSGAGLANIYRFLARGTVAPEPAAISAEAHADPDSVSARALDLFVSIYGARAGDVAFQYMATGGVYLGGGIAPKVLDRLRAGGFMRAFLAEGRLAWLLRRMPVLVILNPDTALYGAAAIASSPPMRAPG